MRFTIAGDGWQEEYRSRPGSSDGDWEIESGDGTAHRFRVEGLGPGWFRITIGETQHVLTLLPGNRPGTVLRCLLDDEYFELNVKNESDLLAEAVSGGGGESRVAEVTSVMPGIVTRVLVAPGDTVGEGQPLLILEAMKMENEIRAPRAGTVSSIAVAPGDTVVAGALLASVESTSP